VRERRAKNLLRAGEEASNLFIKCLVRNEMGAGAGGIKNANWGLDRPLIQVDVGEGGVGVICRRVSMRGLWGGGNGSIGG